MSISSRITEMEQHIGNAYDKIEDLGIDLTDVDKNINNISSMLENVWDEYPKVSVSDIEEASIDGTKKGRMNIDLKGNTFQNGEPTPEVPMPIHNVSGNNNIKIQNKNLFDGEWTGSTSTNFIQVFAGKSYIYSEQNSATAMNYRFYESTSSSSYVQSYVAGGSTYTPSTDGYIKLYKKSTTKTQCQLEQGTTATSYVEHQEQNLPFDLKSKNLFDKNNVKKGTISYNTGDFTVDNSYYASDFINVKPQTQYYCNYVIFSSSAYGLAFYDQNKNYISGRQLINVITVPENASYLRFCVRNENYSGSYITDINTVQLEQGTTATDYEPYYDIKAMQGTTLQDDGIHQKRKQRIFDGTENWYQYGNNVALAKWDNKETPTHGDKSLQGYKCNIAIETTGASQEKTDYTFTTFNSSNVDFIVFHINMSVADWKSYLAEQYANGTPVIVEYELAESELENNIIPYKGVQQEQYNAIKKAHSYDDQTNISQTNDDLPFILNIEALKK